MVILYRGQQNRMRLSIFKGKSGHLENFDKAELRVWLVGRYDQIPMDYTMEKGRIEVVIPEGIACDTWSVKAVWLKNKWRSGCCDKPVSLCGGVPESLAYAYVPNVFAVTNYQQDATFLGAEKVVNVEACVATYGYDGLSAYERAVMLGMTTLSERDWLMTFVANKNYEERITKLEQLVKQYHPDADIDDYTEVIEYSDIEISLTYPSEKAAVAGGVIEPIMWGYMQEKITKVGSVVTGREHITTGAVVRFSNAGTSAEQGFASVDAATGKVTWNENSLNVERSIYVKLEVTLNGKTNVKSVKLTQQAKAVTPAIYGTLKLGDAQDVATKLRKMVVSAVEDGGYSIEKHEVAVVQQHIASTHTNTYDVVLSGDAQACAFFLLPQEYVGKGIVHCAGIFGDESLTNSGGIANVDNVLVEVNGKSYFLSAYVDNALLEDIEYKFAMV